MERVNHLAVLVAAVVFFIFGYVWYGVLFANMYASLMGKPATGAMPAVGALIGVFVVGWVIAYVIAIALGKSADNTAADGIKFGVFMSIGFIATTMLISALTGGMPYGVWAINSAWAVIGIAIMSAIIGGWKKPAAV